MHALGMIPYTQRKQPTEGCLRKVKQGFPDRLEALNILGETATFSFTLLMIEIYGTVFE